MCLRICNSGHFTFMHHQHVLKCHLKRDTAYEEYEYI